MDPLRTLFLPCLGSLPGVAELPPSTGDPLDELDRLPAGDIDGWQKLKTYCGGHDGWDPLLLLFIGGRFGRAQSTFHSIATQFSRRPAPASPDFSGWNWVATKGPFSTAATNGVPCSDQLTLGVITAIVPSGSSFQLSAA